MPNTLTFTIDFDRILWYLFCAFAFSLSFELGFEVMLGIDTIFKPFRILSLLIIGVFGLRFLKKGMRFNPIDSPDVLLYFVFVYGMLVSLVRIISGVFNMGLFYNDVFQFGLHIASFFIFKSIPYTSRQIWTVFTFFFAGALVNGAYIFTQFAILGHFGRQAGFIDNPNYGALGLVACIVFLLLKINSFRRFWHKIVCGLLILFLVYIFIIQGSRTGLVILVMANIILFFFYTIRFRFLLVLLSGLIVLLLMPHDLKQLKVGGGPLILVSRVMKNLNPEEDVRYIVWKGVFRTLEDVGYGGMGIGQFKAQFPKYFGEESHKLILEMVNRGYFLSTHNDYLAILTDYGLPSLFFYLAFLFFTFKRVFRKLIYPSEDDETEMLNRFGFIMLFCLIVFGLAAENFQHPLYWFILAISTKQVSHVKQV